MGDKHWRGLGTALVLVGVVVLNGVGCTNYDMSIAQLEQKWNHARLRYTFRVKQQPGWSGALFRAEKEVEREERG